jgi:hypothetical protein
MLLLHIKFRGKLTNTTLLTKKLNADLFTTWRHSNIKFGEENKRCSRRENQLTMELHILTRTMHRKEIMWWLSGSPEF